jgi:pterin-4a-carbinolamine dehydratase
MSATEILEQFRRMPVEEQFEVLQRIQDEFANELPPEVIARFEERAERLRRHPELGVTWEKVRAELKSRLAQRRACPAK